MGSFCRVNDPQSCQYHTHIRTKKKKKTHAHIHISHRDRSAGRQLCWHASRFFFFFFSNSKLDQGRLSDQGVILDCCFCIVPQSPFSLSASMSAQYFCFVRKKWFINLQSPALPLLNSSTSLEAETCQYTVNLSLCAADRPVQTCVADTHSSARCVLNQGLMEYKERC